MARYVVEPLNAKWRLCSRYPNGGRSVALITAAGLGGLRIATEDGRVCIARSVHSAIALLRSFEDRKWSIFSLVGPTDLARATGPQLWTAWKRQYGGTFYKLKVQDGPVVTPIRHKYDDVSDEQAITGFLALFYALEEYGVMPASLGTMSFHLWRSTLKDKVVFDGPPEARAALYGGRQECLYPGQYKEADYYDLSAAYPTNMAREPFPTRLFPDRLPSLSSPVGIGFATVVIDERQTWHPIPARLNPLKPWYVYGHGMAQGWWPLRELRLAKDEGCAVFLKESWSGRSHFECDLFGEWWQIAKELRALPGFAGKLAKVLTSQLWGKFSLRSVGTSSHTWTDDYAMDEKTLTISATPKSIPQNASTFIAADTTARVREVLWYEGLKDPSSVYCDTDAVIMDNGKCPSGKWRSKLPLKTGAIDIRAPQMLRWLCTDCALEHPEWHYIVAGAKNRDMQTRLFERSHHRLAVNPTWGLTFPSGNIADISEQLKGKKDDDKRDLVARLEQSLRVR